MTVKTEKTKPPVSFQKIVAGSLFIISMMTGYAWCEGANKSPRIVDAKHESKTNIADAFNNVTLSYYNLFEEGLTDKVTLVDGEVLIDEGRPGEARRYCLGTTTVGDLNGDGVAEGCIGVCHEWGANRHTPIVFVFSNTNGALTQIDCVLPDTSADVDRTQIRSLSVNHGVLFVNLLVVSEADQHLPHYKQRPTKAKTVCYKLTNGKLMKAE